MFKYTLISEPTTLKAFPHKVYMKMTIDSFVDRDVMQRIHDWVHQNNIKHEFNVDHRNGNTWYFKDSMDATLFKLKWS